VKRGDLATQVAVAVAVAVAVGFGLAAAPASAQPTTTPAPAIPVGDKNEPEAPASGRSADRAVDSALVAYFQALAADKLIDVDSGNLTTLRAELGTAEGLLRAGASLEAAVALFSIVESPRYAAFGDFVEMQNAEYDLALALLKSGSYGAALTALERVLARGPSALYWGPAHRRAVDLALETREHASVLARLEASPGPSPSAGEPIPVSAAGERAYLRGRIAYDAGKLDEADAALQSITKKSRLYSSSMYLRGVIAARQGKYRNSAAAMCEIAATPDDDKFSFVVDDRYFTVKDLARLGLGRLAHEQSEFDDAYYHYFQIPEDSTYLSEALFEAAWSMYQKRELATARDLVAEMLRSFPTAPMWPEASLLAGYVELADCKFDDSQAWYDKLVAKLDPIVAEMDRVRKDPAARRRLVASALTRWREQKKLGTVDGTKQGSQVAGDVDDELVALLRLDPSFVRLADAVTGAQRLVGEAARGTQLWQGVTRQVQTAKVGKITAGTSSEEDALTDATAVAQEYHRLAEAAERALAELARARRAGVISAADAAAEDQRLTELLAKIRTKRTEARAAADAAATALPGGATAGLRPLLERDVAEARRLDRSSSDLVEKLLAASDALSLRMIERLYKDTRRVLDKARLGKVDAVIGQKRKLDIQVQDLASGRFPAELIGRLWNAGQIGDDEEVWPMEGEYWADEYEGFR
jgi:TolA-binding protein